VPYPRGHAWQHAFLNQRIELQRQQQKNECSNDGNVVEQSDVGGDMDRMLFFQHDPVYTLGRGADENNLVFLNEEEEEIIDAEDEVEHGGISNRRSDREKQRARLSRKARGKDSARLTNSKSFDRIVIGSNETTGSITVKEVAGTDGDHALPPVLAPNGAPVFRIERGGEVTFHGPGQLVVYPLVDLRRPPFKKDLHWYLRAVEEVVLQMLKSYGIEGTRDEENTGIWVGDSKIAAVGVSCSRWITTHGFAINVSSDLSYFDTSLIIPCGIEGKGVTSIAQEMKKIHGENSGMDEISPPIVPPSLEEVAEATIRSFEDVMGVKTQNSDALY